MGTSFFFFFFTTPYSNAESHKSYMYCIGLAIVLVVVVWVCVASFPLTVCIASENMYVDRIRWHG